VLAVVERPEAPEAAARNVPDRKMLAINDRGGAAVENRRRHCNFYNSLS